jgi:hypothetical protein
LIETGRKSAPAFPLYDTNRQLAFAFSVSRAHAIFEQIGVIGSYVARRYPKPSEQHVRAFVVYASGLTAISRAAGR